MRKLDLHGVRHYEVKRVVEDFIYMNQKEMPLEIICGNSNKMIHLVREVTDRIKVETHTFRYGIIIVTGWSK